MKIRKLKESNNIPLLEGTKYDKKASKIISDSGLYDENTSDKIIDALFHEDIHAFNHSPSWLEKYLLGIARMLVEEANGDRGRAQEFLNGCAPVFDQYLNWIRKNRTEENKQKLDNDFVNNLHYKDIKEFLDKIQDELDQQSKDELSKMDFAESNYTLVPINSYEELHSKYGGRVTGDGSSDKYAGGGGTAWCHTNSESVYDSWVSGGNKFFVLQRNNWKDIPFDAKSNSLNPKDDYGTSLIAILVDKYGKLKRSTLRCNHIGVSSMSDNQYETYAELSKVAGFNIEQEVHNVMGQELKHFYITGTDGNNRVPADLSEQVESVTFSNRIKTVPPYSCNGCINLKQVEMPSGATEIGMFAFNRCISLLSVKIPNNVTQIDIGAFAGCTSLKNVVIPNSVTSIKPAAFTKCESFSEVIIGSGVTEVGIGIFAGCYGLERAIIHNGMTYLSNRMFAECNNLTSIAIPSSVGYIGEGAFSNCRNLSIVYFDGSKSEWDAIDIRDDNSYLLNAEIIFNSKNEGLNRNMRRRDIKEKFDTEQVTVQTVNWTRLQNIVNHILEKNGKDIFVEFHSANNRHLSNPYDVFISVFESETGEVVDDEQLSARYYPSGDVIHIFGGGLGDRPLESPEEVSDFIIKTVDYWYKEWSI